MSYNVHGDDDEPGQASPLYDDLRFPGNGGLPPRGAARLVPLSPWARLVEGRGLGKKSNLLYDADHEGPQPAQVVILEIGGDDADACQLSIALTSPAAIPREVADLGIAIQNQTGEFGSSQIGSGNYPGTTDPIVWPPFVAIVEWGTGGAKARAYVDWINGATINLPGASFVRVHASVPPDAINAPGTTGLYTLAAFLSPGWPRPGSAQRTIFIDVLGSNSESDVFVVPPFAKRATVIGRDPLPIGTGIPALTVATLRFWQSPDGTHNVGNYLCNGNQPLPFNVPNAGQYFSVVNESGIKLPLAVCFELSI